MENPSRQDYYADLPLPPAPPQPPLIPTPDNPPWGIWAAICMWLASVFFILIVPAFFLLPYLVSKPEQMGDPELLTEFAKTDPVAIFLQIIGIIPAHVLTLVLAWVIVTRWRKFSFSQTLGWKSGGFRWWHYVAILVVFMGVGGVVSNYFPEQENDLIRMLQSSRSAVYIIALVATFTAPLVEEVVYRGVVYSAFQHRFGIPAGFLVATLLFALVHVPQYYPSYSTIFLLTLLSVTLTAVRLWSGNLLPCIILHTLFNGLQSILLILEPYLKPVAPPDPASFIFHIFR
jgi:uncharacterized protein